MTVVYGTGDERSSSVSVAVALTAVARSSADDGCNDGGNDNDDNDNDPEADPALLAGLPRRADRLVGVLETLVHVGLDLGTLLLDHVERVILFVDQDRHLVEELGELGNGPLDSLNVLVTLLDFSKCALGLTVPVRVEKGLREDLAILVVVQGSLDLLLSGIGLDNAELTLGTSAVLLAVGLLDLLVSLDGLLESVFDSTDLGIADILIASSRDTLGLGLEQLDAIFDTVGEGRGFLLDGCQLLLGVLGRSLVHVVEGTGVEIRDFVDVLVDETDGVLDLGDVGEERVDITGGLLAGNILHLVCVVAGRSSSVGCWLSLGHLTVCSLLGRSIISLGLTIVSTLVVCISLLLWGSISLLWLTIAALWTALWTALLLCWIRVVTVAVVSASVASVAASLLGLSSMQTQGY